MPANRSPSAAPDSLIGQTIGGQYTLQRVLGQGSKAQVFLATHRTLQRPVVVHLLNAPWADDPVAGAKFEEQARTLRGLEHPNIAALIDFGRDGSRVFVVSEYVEGNLLSDYVHQLGRLPLESFVPIAAQILKGVGATHARGLVHRDLKPANVVLVEEQGRANYVKILDLGLAQMLVGPPLDEEPPIVGTPAYLAPEQIMNKPVDARSDVYAIGAMFYFLLSGRLPFEGDNAAAVLYKHINDKPTPLTSVLPGDHHLPDGLIELVHDCLAKNPDNRPNDANEIVERMIDCVPAAMFRLPIAGVQAVPRVATGPQRAGTGPNRAAARPDTGPVRAPTGDYRRIPTPQPMMSPLRPDLAPRPDSHPDRALAAAMAASGVHPIPNVDATHAPTVPLPEERRSGGGGWILGVLALLLTGGLVYVYIESQKTPIVAPAGKVEAKADPSKALGDVLSANLARAREHDQAGRLQEAIVAYEAVLTADPNHAQARDRITALKAQLAAKPSEPTTPPDTKVEPTPDTKVEPTPDSKTPPDTKVEPTPDSKTPTVDSAPVAFTVEATGPRKAEVVIDGVSKGKTPLKLDIPPGSHKFEIKAAGFTTHEETIDVAADGQKELKVKLERKPSAGTGTGTPTGPGGISRAEEDAASAQLDPDAGVETKFETKK